MGVAGLQALEPLDLRQHRPEPEWGANGKTLIYRSTNHTVTEVPVTIEGSQIRFGTPRKLFDLYLSLDVELGGMDLAPDGERFVVNAISEEVMRAPATVVVELKVLDP